MKRFFYHSILSLFLLVMFCITGGGNLAKAQDLKSVTLDFEGTGTFPYNADWTITNLSVYSVSPYTRGSNSASTSGTESAVAKYNNKLENISKVVYYISKTTTNAKPSYFLVETSTDGSNWVDQGHSPTFDKIIKNEWTEVIVTLATPVTGFVRVSYKGTTAVRLIDDITVYYGSTEPTGSTDPELSYSSSSFTIAANGTPTEQPTLNNPNSVTIKSYSSSNTSVATVTGEGVIALAGGTGTATITATSQADKTYAVGTATYTLTVFGAPEITPERGEYAKSVDVAISATDAAALWYTTDGSEPTIDNAAATKVTEFPVNLKLGLGEHTVKAITAYDEEGTILSNVETRTYNVLDKEIIVVEKSSFSELNGKIDEVVSYSTSKGGAGNVPYLDSNKQIRLYQISGSNSYGGTIKISAAKGYELSSVTIGSSMTTSISYTLDDNTILSPTTPLSANGKYTKEGLANSSITFYCMGNNSSTRLYVNYISVTYTPKAGTVATPEITFSKTETWGAPIDVRITATGASHIWYTTDGTDPTADGATPIKKEGESTLFTLSEPGNYTIKAIALNDNGDYSQLKTATCVINKATPGSAKMKYKKVTSNDDIVDGGVYLLVCPEFSEAMSTRENNITYAGVGSVSFEDDAQTIISSVSTINESSFPCELVLEAVPGEDGVYYIKDAGSYIYWSSSTTLGSNESLPADKTKYKWTISFNTEDWGQGRIAILNTSAGNRTLDINESTTPHRFSTYVINNTITWSSPSFLYKKTFDLSVNANTAGYATAYTAFPYVMPASANGYIVTETAEGQTIKAKQKYPAGAEVPANAPLLIKNADAGVTLNPVVLGKTVEAYPYAEENLLHGTRLESDGVTTDVDGTGTNTANYYYYKLSYKLEPGNPVAYGFYRGKADGSAFEMKNTLTAYLALPRSSGQVNNLRISIDNEDGPATSIHANRIPAENMPQSVYTLSGVRVNAAGNRLPKGIYIVNGKKVVIK